MMKKIYLLTIATIVVFIIITYISAVVTTSNSVGFPIPFFTKGIGQNMNAGDDGSLLYNYELFVDIAFAFGITWGTVFLYKKMKKQKAQKANKKLRTHKRRHTHGA